MSRPSITLQTVPSIIATTLRDDRFRQLLLLLVRTHCFIASTLKCQHGIVDIGTHKVRCQFGHCLSHPPTEFRDVPLNGGDALVTKLLRRTRVIAHLLDHLDLSTHCLGLSFNFKIDFRNSR